MGTIKIKFLDQKHLVLTKLLQKCLFGYYVYFLFLYWHNQLEVQRCTFLFPGPLFLQLLSTVHEFGSISDLLDYINPSQDGKGRDALAMKRKPYNSKVHETALYTKYMMIFFIINGETRGFILFCLLMQNSKDCPAILIPQLNFWQQQPY